MLSINEARKTSKLMSTLLEVHSHIAWYVRRYVLWKLVIQKLASEVRIIYAYSRYYQITE